MKNIDPIYINNLSKLHNNKTIFFCKTDYIFQDFEQISKLNNDVILITGNSDYAITDDLIRLAPKNIKLWYAQNAISNSKILIPLPIGLENKLVANRDGHGVAYPNRAYEKEIILKTINTTIPTKFIYANFNVNTNPKYRSIIREYCINSKFIDWEEPNLSISSFFKQLQNYKMVVCPAGNGLDTHRLWEVLYADRIPITIKTGNYKIYELYEQLPIILLNSFDELYDINYIEQKYNECKNKKFNLSLLNSQFWIDKIINN